MKQTAMQDLRQDLLDTIVTGSDALNEIEDEQIRNGTKTLFQTTINTIISRIDEELLEMEKQQIIDAGNSCALKQHLHIDKMIKMSESEIIQFAEEEHLTFGEEYYNETFNK
jgi:hypothetical protein